MPEAFRIYRSDYPHDFRDGATSRVCEHRTRFRIRYLVAKEPTRFPRTLRRLHRGFGVGGGRDPSLPTPATGEGKIGHDPLMSNLSTLNPDERSGTITEVNL